MRRLRIAVVAVVALSLLGGAAIAYFHGIGSGSASASVGTLSPPSNVIATVPSGNGTVHIAWNAGSGLAPQGYYLLRHRSGGGTAAACGTSAASLTTATSCNDSGVADGGYTYTVVAKYRTFTASADSNAVTVINDLIAPTVTVNQKAGQADPANGLPIVFTVTFSEPVTGFASDDLTRGGTSTGGTVAVTGSGSAYEISVSGALTDGTLSFSIAAGGAQDLAGNSNTASTSTDNTVTYDATAPALTLTTPVNGSATTDTTPSISGTAGNATGDSTTVTMKIYSGTGTGGSVVQTLTPTRSTNTWSTTAATLAQGTYTAQATQTDTAGNVATSTANTFAVDTTAPTVTVNQKAGQSDPANALPILFTVTFSEPVTGFVAADATRGGTSTGGTVAVTGSGASYEISLTGAVTDGTVSFSITAAKAQDLAGNSNTASTSTDNTVSYDGTAPALTLTTPANGSATTDATPSVSGAAGNASGDASTVTVKIYSGSGTGGSVVQTLTPTRSTNTWSTTAATLAQGTYTVQATQTDTAGNVATSAANTFAVDTTAPTVTVNQKAGQSDPANALPILFTVTFNEPVAGFTSADLTRGGTSTGGTVGMTGSGASYEISVTGGLTDGTLTFSIASGRAQDPAGNSNTASTSTDNSVTYDSTAPALTLTAPANGSATSDTTPAISGAAGNAGNDSTTVTVKIYSGTGTGGSVLQTLTPTRSTNTWSTTAATLAQGTYTAQATQTDAAGNTATSAANTFTVDTTAPALTALQMFDTDANGKIDEVRATFDETLASSTATSPWTLANVPSSGTLNSVSTSGAVATLTLNEGAAAANTAVGGFTIALATSATGIRDTAGNQASFVATGVDDLAGPVLMTATSTAGTTANRMQAGDTLVLTFSEALAPTSLAGTFIVTEQRAGAATLTIPGLINSATIGGSYLGANNSSAASSNSPSALGNLNKTVTVTLGTITTTGSGVGTGTGGASISPASTLTDPAGNAARTTARTMSPLF
ncbi:MAG: large repetitive protein [Solirubrobacteraceae bacterium]